MRFSIGFGRPLWRWQRLQPGIGLPTEFTVCAIPLGGFIKMLDARDQQIDSAELPSAFSSQPLGAKAIIVAAGPVANLLLTFCIYAGLQWLGGLQTLPVISTPTSFIVFTHYSPLTSHVYCLTSNLSRLTSHVSRLTSNV